MTAENRLPDQVLRRSRLCLSAICLLGTLAQTASALSSARVYPNPFKPSAGHQFITFDTLQASTTIRVYNSNSVSVSAFSGDLAGLAHWDFKDAYGSILPDGVYYAVATAPDQASSTLFLLKEVGGPGQTPTPIIPALSPGTVLVGNYDENAMHIGTTTLMITDGSAGIGYISLFLLTPNGDGLNDTVVVCFDNPMDNALSGQILNTRGEVVSSMTPGPIASCLQWDGKTGGVVVPNDLYYMNLAATPTKSKSWVGVWFILVNIMENPVVRNIPTLPPQTKNIFAAEAGNAMNGLLATGLADPFLAPLIGTTVQVMIRGTDAGSVSVVGGAKGYVNPAIGEKLTVGFKAAGAGTVKTKIFNGTGRLVRELSASTDGNQGGSLQWDGRDSGGRIVASGVYLIHVEGPGINVTKRTVILK